MLCALLFSVTAWGQEPTPPTLSLLNPSAAYDDETNPYVVASAEDWGKLATDVASGYSYEGKVIKLTADIGTIENPITTMVGVWHENADNRKPFEGHFSGKDGDDIHIITFIKETEGNVDNPNPIALFQNTHHATFSDLIIAGRITTHYDNAAGLIGINTRNNDTDKTSVENVINGIFIDCYFNDDDEKGPTHCGGFAVDGSGVEFNNCVYNGKFEAWDKSGGFCGKGSNKTKLRNSLFNPTEGSGYMGSTFVFYDDVESGYIIGDVDKTCYYTLADSYYNGVHGSLAYKNAPDNKITQIKHILDYGFYDYIEVEISLNTENNVYDWTGNEITVTATITFDGETPTVGSYTSPIITDDYGGHTVQDIGDYTITIDGENTEGYYGSISKTFKVVSNVFGNWDDLKSLLESNSSITLTCNYRNGTGGSGTLIINRDIEIDLNGFTIDRNLSEATEEGQVIRINSGKTVSITGPGVITGAWNKAKTTTEHGEYNDGGGIYNKGTLTLNTVTIANNKCVKKETGTSSTARGGGIYSGQGSSLTMTNVIVKNNHAQGGGGGVFAEQASVSMTNCTVRSNESLDKGGGIRLKKCGTTNISSTDITYNAADNSGHNSVANGGGIHMEDGTLNLTSCNINNNNSSKFGGGMYILSGTVNATNCNINYNQCYDDDGMFNSRGGGVYIHGGSFKMNGGTITGNSSKMANGGGVFINSSGAEFHVEGAVQIKDNFKIDENGYTDPTPTNVFIAGKTNSDVIHVDGDITGAEIWVSKNGGSGSITTGLEGHGSPSQFKSDEGYIIPDGDSEAALDTPPTWTNGAALPVGVTEVTSNNYTIDKPVIVDTRLTDVTSVSFTDDGCLIIKEGGYLGTNIILDDEDSKKDRRVVVYGGEFVPTNALPATIPAIMKKDIHSATGDGKYWYIFSSAVNTPNIITKTNVITIVGYNEETGYVDNQYDLYRFNEAVVKQWENYRSTGIVHEGFSANQPASSLENGRGYLYRNENNYTLTLTGDLNLSGVNYELSYSETVDEKDNPFKGFNIIGNPYSHNIYKGAVGSAIPNDLLEAKYYVLDPEDGSWDLTNDGTAIPPMTGILVQAKAAGTLTMANSMDGYVAPSKGNDDNNNIWFAVANSKYEDKACIEFRKGHGLNKISHLNEEAPMLYVNYNGEKFASADVNPAAKVVNLNFEAKTTGMFTLSCKANGNFSYLHLYDRLTGNDVDMLLDGEYTFIASPTDNENRFLVVLDPLEALETLDGTFAYQNGNDIIVNGEGNLQIFDVMGRLIATQRVNGVETVNVSTTGVYIFKLNEKTQKIVVR